jgi:pSer/pThr/pTyr-binding forkhead associated (FHA) protein
MAKLVLSCGGSVLNNYFIEKPRVTIGRDLQNDIVIDDAVVGSEHAAIITVGADQIIDGLESVYGTFVNGKPISRQILQHRDVIEFGAHSLCYINSRAAQEKEFDRTMVIAALPVQAGSATSSERTAPASRTVNVRFPNGRIRNLNASAAPVELNRVVTLVGTPGSMLAVITRRPHGYFLSHVEGKYRARLNGRPVGEKPLSLRSGDVIKVAGERFEFLLDIVPAH